MAKYGMSLCTLGMAAEFKGRGVAVNSLWPLTAIDTAAVRFALGGAEMAAMCRGPLQGDFFVPDAVFECSPTKIRRGY